MLRLLWQEKKAWIQVPSFRTSLFAFYMTQPAETVMQMGASDVS